MTSVLRLAFCAAVLAVSSAWAGPYSIDSIETSGTTFATGASVGSTFERMRITQGGLVGISNTSPVAKLDVNGTVNYIGLMAPMVKAMQQMKAENDVVAAQNRQLRESLHNLAAEMKSLRKSRPARSQRGSLIACRNSCAPGVTPPFPAKMRSP